MFLYILTLSAKKMRTIIWYKVYFKCSSSLTLYFKCKCGTRLRSICSITKKTRNFSWHEKWKTFYRNCLIRSYKTIKSRYNHHVSVFFFLLIENCLYIKIINISIIYIFWYFSNKLCKVLFYFRFHSSTLRTLSERKISTTFIKYKYIDRNCSK